MQVKDKQPFFHHQVMSTYIIYQGESILIPRVELPCQGIAMGMRGMWELGATCVTLWVGSLWSQLIPFQVAVVVKLKKRVFFTHYVDCCIRAAI